MRHATLRREVKSLLAQPASDESFLQAPAITVAAELVTRTAPSTMVGRRFGVYEIDSLLSAGGMGEVYRARDTKLARNVAIKVLPPAFLHEPDRLARFQREARMLAA